jgi:phenylpropionate dioxygenase-like ring-hydroxylating dioxygenase large terminal subunit
MGGDPGSCNWKVSVENYSECYHCTINHPTFATGVVKPETYDIQPQGYCLRHTTECQNLDRMSYPVIYSGSNPQRWRYSSWFLWPMFSFQVYPGNVLNTYHWRPHGPDKCTVWRGWYTVGGSTATSSAAGHPGPATTVEEDIRIVESVQRGLKARDTFPGRWCSTRAAA